MLRAQLSWLVAVLSLASAATATISGTVTDPAGQPVAGAVVMASAGARTVTAGDGSFRLEVASSDSCTLRASAPGFRDATAVVTGNASNVDLRFSGLEARRESIAVIAGPESTILNPDPAQRVYAIDDVLGANPGRPGAPISIPGLPVETASGGLKAPQYFAPGVAGDHGEPIAMFLAVGGFLVPNNLSANAHGNGYSDPNPIIPAAIEDVQVDGGAFNVREGNHSVDLAETYGFRDRLPPFVSITGDFRDIDLSTGWTPAAPDTRAWIAIEAACGDGLHQAPEHRRQYKLNGYRQWTAGPHEITLLGTGYYGSSRIPGLVPIGVPGLGDTIDPRQRDQTHSVEVALNDVWNLGTADHLQLSGFIRTYNLSLESNFGDGLIRQREFRTVAGGNATWVHDFSRSFSILSGMDYLRDAPRRLDLDRYQEGGFQSITANDATLSLVTPYVAIDGRPARWLGFDVGWRRDQIDIVNFDRLRPANSTQGWVGVNSPKATISLAPPESMPLPMLSLSFGQTFFTNDPRIGNGAREGAPVTRAHSWQVVLSRTVLNTDLRVTVGRITQEQSLAKIDPDTGLQFDVGPGRNRFVTFAARHYFHRGSVQASVSKADARDVLNGLAIPEAPRLIIDVLGAVERLPFRLEARAEYEEVGRRPLGDGFVSVPVREFRGALVRPFHNGRMEVGVNFMIASGYTGQTTEVLAIPGDEAPFERVVGVSLPSYVSLSWTWRPAHLR